MSEKSKKLLYAFLLKTALKEKDTSQSNKYPRATLNCSRVAIVPVRVKCPDG